MEASIKEGCGLSGCFAAASIDSLSVSVQVQVSDTPPGMLARRPDKLSSELLEFLRIPSRQIEQLAPGRPSTMPVTVSVHSATTTTTITTHTSMASATGVAVVATGVHASIGVRCATVVYGYDHSICLTALLAVCRSCTIVWTGFGPYSS